MDSTRDPLENEPVDPDSIDDSLSPPNVLADIDSDRTASADSHRGNTGSQTQEPASAEKPGWHWTIKVAVSLALVWHGLAVLAGPASVNPSSPLQQKLSDNGVTYLRALALDNGYHFFAPNPGTNSTLLSYRVVRADGTEVVGRIPDRNIQPRVLYHRHFMLTERMHEFETQHTTDDGNEEWTARGPRSYARHLCHKHNGDRVELTLIQHSVPLMESVLAGKALDDPEFYTETPLGVFTRKELLP